MSASSFARGKASSVPTPTAQLSAKGRQSQFPPTFQLTTAEPVQRQEPCPADNDYGFTPGELTINGEGAGDETLHLHWPGNAASGVTIGYGYDLGQRSAAEIRGHMEAAGLPANQVSILVNAAGVTGGAAGTFVQNNTAAFGSITEAQRVTIFQNILPQYEARARGRATSDFYGGGAGSVSEDLVLTGEQYDALHPAIHELLVDMTFQGAYSPNSRWGGTYDRINPILLSDDDSITKMRNLVTALNDYLAGGNLPSGAPRRTRLRIQMLEAAIAKEEERLACVENNSSGSTTTDGATGEQAEQDSNGWLPDWLRWPF